MKPIFFLFFITVCSLTLLYSQDHTAVLYPGRSITNLSPDTMICLSKQKIEILMDREKISAGIIQELSARNAITDSLLVLKTCESEGWYSKLIETDKILELSEQKMIRELHRSRKKTRIMFGIGIVAGLVIGLVL